MLPGCNPELCPFNSEDFQLAYIRRIHGFLVKRFGPGWRRDWLAVTKKEAPDWVTPTPFGLPQAKTVARFETALVEHGFRPATERKIVADAMFEQQNIPPTPAPVTPGPTSNTFSA